jgi:Flp pilus assembly protein TadG
MRTPPSRRRDGQRGQILVIVAGGLIGLLAFGALALEGGTLVLNRRDAQNAADLASLAGTRVVAQSHTSGGRTQADVLSAVRGSLDSNDCSLVATTTCTWTANFVGAGLADLGVVGNTGSPVPGNALGVRVGVTRQPTAFLGRVLGFDHWTVSTDGTSLAARPSSFPTGILLPIAVCGWFNGANPNDCPQAANTPTSNAVDYKADQVYDLTDGKDAPGGFGWLSWTGSNSAGALATSICSPNNTGFSLDSPYDDPHGTGEVWFPVDPGKSNASAVRACLDGWIASKTTVLVPIYDLVEGNGNNARYHITGVAAFILTTREQPAVDNIQGTFVKYYPYTDIPGGLGTVPPDQSDTTYFLGLVR